MKAAVLTAYNKIEWLDVEKPSCKPGEVLIKVMYGCICGSDQHIHKGEFHPRTKTPLIIGHEFGGLVAEVGEGVEGWAVGYKVAPDPIIWCGKCPACLKGHYPACTTLKLIGVDSDGEFAEAIEHLKNGRLKPEALISKVLHGSQTQRGFEILDENPAENIKILLDFRS